MEKKKKCSKCGKDFDIWDNNENFSIIKRGGYGTKYDGSNIELHLCCKCMEELIDMCLIPPVQRRSIYN